MFGFHWKNTNSDWISFINMPSWQWTEDRMWVCRHEFSYGLFDGMWVQLIQNTDRRSKYVTSILFMHILTTFKSNNHDPFNEDSM